MSKVYNDIVQKYYNDILRYCNSRLDDNNNAAQDCTQAVFLALAKKIKRLDLSLNIKKWLYSTADKEIKSYIRKHPPAVSIEEIPEQIDYDSDLSSGSILEELTEEERKLVRMYYGGENKIKIARDYGISISALHSRVRNIKKKLKKIRENDTNTV